MSSAGSISAMITSLKNNKALRKAIKFKKYNSRFSAPSRENIRLQFKELSPLEIKSMKQRIRKETRRQDTVYFLLFFALLILSIIGTFFLFKGVFW